MRMARNRILGVRAQTRASILANTAVYGCFFLLLSLLQASLLGRFRPFGTLPDLAMCGVLGVAYFAGKYTGAVSGLFAGFLVEALGAHGISLLPLCYLLLGYTLGHYASAGGGRRPLRYLLFLLLGLLARAGVTLLYLYLTYQTLLPLSHTFLDVVLPELCATAVCGLLLWFPSGLVTRIPARFGGRRRD